MENQYDVGIANRYALFLEEGENSLTAIKKKLSKEIRQKNKAIKKENAEARKAEAAAKVLEKPEPQPEAIEVPAPKKEFKEEKSEAPKSKEKKSNDTTPNRKDKESQDKSRNVKNGADAAVAVAAVVEDSWDTPVDAAAAPEPVAAAEKDFAKPFNENGPPRKNYERRPPRERKFENSDQSQSPRPYNSQYNNKRNYNNSGSYNNSNGGGGGNSGGNSGGNYYNKEDDWGAKTWDENDGGDGGAAGDNAANRYPSNENRGPRENGYGPPHSGSEYRPRGGGRFRGDSRGGRRYNGPDRRKEYNNDQQSEQKDDSNVFKGDSWGDENTENTNNEIPADNQKEDENKGTENDGSATDEQKEVKEYLTLDEWKKLQGERQKPQYNLRKAGEGEDLTQWKNMRELEKKKDEEFLETNNRHPERSNHHDHEKENAGNENVQRVGRQKHIDINVHFRESSSRGRGGRIIRNNRFGGGYKPRNEYRSDGNDRNDRGERDRFDRNDRDRFERNDRDRFERNDRDRFERNDRDRFERNDRDRPNRYERNDRERYDRYDRNDRSDRNDSNTYSGETRSFRKPREPREGGYVGRGGGGNRGPPTVRQNAPKMDDESAFPSLG